MTPRKIVPQDSHSFLKYVTDRVEFFIEPTIWLDLAREWIRNNLHPEDVFTLEQLQLWAKEEGYEHQYD